MIFQGSIPRCAPVKEARRRTPSLGKGGKMVSITPERRAATRIPAGEAVLRNSWIRPGRSPIFASAAGRLTARGAAFRLLAAPAALRTFAGSLRRTDRAAFLLLGAGQAPCAGAARTVPLTLAGLALHSIPSRI